MKVMFIGHFKSATTFSGKHAEITQLVYGNIYNAIEEEMYFGILFYELQGYKNKLFQADAFVPISDIDEEKLSETRKKEQTFSFVE